MTHETRVTTVTVNVAHEGSYLIASSADVPGLHVWGESEQQVCERVVQAIKLLFKWNKGVEVDVFQASDPVTFPEMPSSKQCSNFVIAAHA